MFGGGQAHLSFIGSDDWLEAGLEIYAQPPGKKLATLSLLSGGEQTLTALALLFAVFLCNPAPVCVLDEVDAPLDEANVERFCDLLADLGVTTGTRFLIVTHHPLTMARMDRLYGVTMQERGVSRLVSVDLSAAVRLAEPIRLAAEQFRRPSCWAGLQALFTCRAACSPRTAKSARATGDGLCREGHLRIVSCRRNGRHFAAANGTTAILQRALARPAHRGAAAA